MADENFNPGQWPEQKPSIGTGEGEVPLASPLPPKIDIRTMATDQKSIEESGSVMPRPYVPPPTVSQTKEKIFTTPQIDSTPTPPPPIPADFKTIKSKSKKKPFVLVFALVLIIGAGVLGYFVVYPKFFKVAPPLTPVCGNGICENGEDTSNCSGDCETPPPPPLASVCGNGLCETDESETNCSVDCQIAPPPPAPTGHNSLFKIAADFTENADSSGLEQVLKFNTAESPVFKEIVLSLTKPSGESIGSNKVTQLLMPSLFTDELTNNFEDDLTFFVYTNNKGTWPGFVAKIKSDVNTANLQSDISKKIIEAPTDASGLRGFFSGADPGQPQTWKTGQTNGFSNNYLAFEKAGFSINFAWIENKLLMSSSYEGFKEAIRRLQ